MGELMEGQSYRLCKTSSTTYDSKRMHVAQTMYGINEDGSEFLSATMEWMSLVRLPRNPAVCAVSVQEVLGRLSQRCLGRPQGLGSDPAWVSRSIGLPPGKSLVRP